MKYEDKEFTRLEKRTLRKLEKIAMDNDYALEQRGGIDCRNNDSEDFPEVSIWGLQRMLEKAYMMGWEDRMKKEKKV